MSNNKNNKNKNTKEEKKTTPVPEKQKTTTVTDEPEKDKRNKKTAGANLSFNVMKFKEWMSNYLRDNGHTVSVMVNEKNDDEDDGKDVDRKKVQAFEVPKINNGDAALTAANEALCRYFIDLVMKRVGKDDTSGLYNVHRRDMTDVIQLTPELNYFFSVHLDRYNKSIPVQYCVPMKEVEAFLEREFHGNVNFSDKARSFLAYFLLAFSCDLVNTAYELLLYADKKMVNPSSITSAIRIGLTGSLRDSLITKVNETVKNLKAVALKNSSEKTDSPKDTKTSKETKNTKKSDVTISDGNEDSDADNNNNDDDENAGSNNDDDDDEAEPEPEPEPVKAKKTKNTDKKNGKSSNSSS